MGSSLDSRLQLATCVSNLDNSHLRKMLVFRCVRLWLWKKGTGGAFKDSGEWGNQLMEAAERSSKNI